MFLLPVFTIALMFRLVVFRNVIVDITISCRPFVFCLSRAKISARLTNVSGLAVAASDLVYCPLSASSRRKVVFSLCATHML